MTLTDIVTTYEISLKLKEANFDEPSVFIWVKALGKQDHSLQVWNSPTSENILEPGIGQPVKAYTFEQIAKMMPHKLALWVEDPFVEVVEQTYYGYKTYFNVGVNTNIADAAATCWLWCEEKGYIS